MLVKVKLHVAPGFLWMIWYDVFLWVTWYDESCLRHLSVIRRFYLNTIYMRKKRLKLKRTRKSNKIISSLSIQSRTNYLLDILKSVNINKMFIFKKVAKKLVNKNWWFFLIKFYYYCSSVLLCFQNSEYLLNIVAITWAFNKYDEIFLWFTLISDIFQIQFIYLLLEARGTKLGFAFVAMTIDNKNNNKRPTDYGRNTKGSRILFLI